MGGSSFTPNALLAGKKYYYAGSSRIAVRDGSSAPTWIAADHLGSTSKTTDYAGTTVTSTTLYEAWGTTRYTSGTMPTKYTYTGQYSYTGDFGLMYYGARYYDPSLGRWNQPDTILPQGQGTQAWDRMAYVNNNPLSHTDPTGHNCKDITDPSAQRYCHETEYKEQNHQTSMALDKLASSSSGQEYFNYIKENEIEIIWKPADEEVGGWVSIYKPNTIFINSENGAFENAAELASALIHETTHLKDGMPGTQQDEYLAYKSSEAFRAESGLKPAKSWYPLVRDINNYNQVRYWGFHMLKDRAYYNMPVLPPEHLRPPQDIYNQIAPSDHY